ncbi:MAG: hypothetical protein HN576_12085 [Bacteriovoracaceae bacterium]|nr:hypothetical protein [Bacteriovoracaceae bacterium]
MKTMSHLITIIIFLSFLSCRQGNKSSITSVNQFSNKAFSASSSFSSAVPTLSTGLSRSTVTAVPKLLTLSYLLKLAKMNNTIDVVIEEGTIVEIDQSLDLGFIKVLGILRCKQNLNVNIKTDGILVMGPNAKLKCGSLQNRFTGKIQFILKNYRELSDLIINPMHTMGGKAIAAMNGATISLHGDIKNSGYSRLDQNLNQGEKELIIADSKKWSKDDEIVVSTTSFYKDHHDLFKILNYDENSKKIFLSKNADFFHYGKMQNFKDEKDNENYSLDERAFVANLTRNIVIMSELDQYTQNQLGAHMMIMHGSYGYIDGVEFYRVGQMEKMGRYPFHWHRSGDVSGQYIKNSSIHESYNRCITIHNSFNAELNNNTCFNHYGHGFFLEEGNEVGNIIQYNLGMYSRKPEASRALLKSDWITQPADRFPGPATFWISNPDNDVRFNIASGSEGSGFWMAFVENLNCDSMGCTLAANRSQANVFPLTTNTDNFSDNEAHSAVTGITWDGAPMGDLLNNNLLNSNDRELVSAHYKPQIIPEFNNLIVSKGSRAGIYFRGEQVNFKNTILADNGTAAFFAYNQILQDSIIVATSDNYDSVEKAYQFDQSIASHSRHTKFFEGIRVYDGSFVLDNVYFANFNTEKLMINNMDFTSTPISLTGGAERFGNAVKHVNFSNIPYRKFLFDHKKMNWQDSYTASVRDINGDLTGFNGSLIRPNHAINDYPGCQQSLEGLALICPYEISNLRFNAGGTSTSQHFNVKRSDGPEFIHNPFHPTAIHYNKFSMIMDPILSYTISDFNFYHDSSIQTKFVSNDLGDISPIIIIESGQNLPCSLDNLKLDEGLKVFSLEKLRTINDTAYMNLNGKFVFKIKSDSIKENITNESAQGRNLFNIQCQ